MHSYYQRAGLCVSLAALFGFGCWGLLPHWRRCHYCIGWLSPLKYHSLSQASSSSTERAQLWMCHVIQPGRSKMIPAPCGKHEGNCYEHLVYGTTTFDWHWAISASPASILEKRMPSKRCISCNEDAQEFLTHSSQSLRNTRDKHILYSKFFSFFSRKDHLLSGVTSHCTCLQICGSSNKVEIWENNDCYILCRC